MPFLKHIGRQGDKKVIVLFRQVPNEEHMSLIIYPELLQASWHDSIIKVLESAMGQEANEFADALHRSMFPDGRLMLETLHRERIIKKVRTSDIIMTPLPNSSIKLDELNKILNEMASGENAIKRMAEDDATRGLVEPHVKRQAEARYKESIGLQQPITPVAARTDDVLSDDAIAANMVSQSDRMLSEANTLIAEANRLKEEAAKMTASVVTIPAVKAKRGRPKKNQVKVDVM